jgi:hypothetical protein
VDFHSLPVPHDDGHFISDRVSRTVQLIREYDSRLDVVWLPPERRENPNDPEFYVVERMPDGRTLPVFSIQNESFMDERLLERIYENDAEKQGNVMDALDARNKAKRDMMARESLDREAEMRDIAAHVLASRKSTYKANGKVYRD